MMPHFFERVNPTVKIAHTECRRQVGAGDVGRYDHWDELCSVMIANIILLWARGVAWFFVLVSVELVGCGGWMCLSHRKHVLASIVSFAARFGGIYLAV